MYLISRNVIKLNIGRILTFTLFQIPVPDKSHLTSLISGIHNFYIFFSNPYYTDLG